MSIGALGRRENLQTPRAKTAAVGSQAQKLHVYGSGTFGAFRQFCDSSPDFARADRDRPSGHLRLARPAKKTGRGSRVHVSTRGETLDRYIRQVDSGIDG